MPDRTQGAQAALEDRERLQAVREAVQAGLVATGYPSTSWQIQLTGALNSSFQVSMYDIDLFDNSAQAIASLKAKGARVICYSSAGSFEDWRPDASSFPSAVRGSPLDGWDGEWWLDIRSQIVREIMAQRMDLAAKKGCDGATRVFTRLAREH